MKDKHSQIMWTGLSVLVTGLLIFLVYRFNIPNPNMILISALVVFTGACGVIPGAVSGVMMLLYSMFFFSTDHSFFRYTDVNAVKIVIVFLGTAACYASVALLRRSHDRAFRQITEALQAKQETQEMRSTLEQARSQVVTFSGIAHALSSDYNYLYYVNIANDRFTEFSTDTASGRMTVIRDGEDFFVQAGKDAETQLYALDRSDFLDAFTKENILRSLDEFGRFTLTYRLMVDGVPRYMSMKATRMEEDENYLVFGVMDVDSQMKEQEAAERIREEKNAFNRVIALAGDFTVFYTVDPQSGKYIEYSVTSAYETLGLAKQGDDFFASSAVNARSTVCREDLDLFLHNFTRENVMRAIEEDGSFSMRYRLMMEGQLVHVRLRAAIVQEKEGPQLIVGVQNIDTQVRQEAEFDRSLESARLLARKDGLTGVRNKLGYTDMENELNYRIALGEKLQLAVAVFDLNNLKTVNDTLGHAAGDDYIRQACEMLCDAFRHSAVFRIGGDEFAVISRDSDYEHMEERIEALEEINRRHMETGEAVLACGMARYQGESCVADVFARADALMYEDKRAKKAGR